MSGSVYATMPSDIYFFMDLPGQADGNYAATPVEVRRSITFGNTYAVSPQVWGRGVETIGYANIDPNFTFGWCEPVGAVSKTGCTLRTYVFDVYTVGGQHVGWFPTQPGDVKFAYSVNGIKDLAPPSVTVVSPNGGNYFELGNEMTITWNLTDEYPQGVQCSVYLVRPSGTPSTYQVAAGLFVGSAGSFNWEIPSFVAPANTYKIKVVAQDTNGHQGIDLSNGAFTIAENGGGHGGDDPPCEYPCNVGPGKPLVYLTDLMPANPNPFGQATHLRFTLKDADEIALRVYDVNGRVVRNVTDGFRGKGTHDVAWDGRDNSGRRLPSGVYFVGLTTSRQRLTQKIVVVR